MAGLAGKSGPPGNQNAFRHGLAGISQRRNNGALNPTEHSIREEILSGLLAKGRGSADQHRHARAGRDNRQRRGAASQSPPVYRLVTVTLKRLDLIFLSIKISNDFVEIVESAKVVRV